MILFFNLTMLAVFTAALVKGCKIAYDVLYKKL